MDWWGLVPRSYYFHTGGKDVSWWILLSLPVGGAAGTSKKEIHRCRQVLDWIFLKICFKLQFCTKIFSVDRQHYLCTPAVHHSTSRCADMFASAGPRCGSPCHTWTDTWSPLRSRECRCTCHGWWGAARGNAFLKIFETKISIIASQSDCAVT